MPVIDKAILELSDYEKERLKRIEENNVLVKMLFPDGWMKETLGNHTNHTDLTVKHRRSAPTVLRKKICVSPRKTLSRSCKRKTSWQELDENSDDVDDNNSVSSVEERIKEVSSVLSAKRRRKSWCVRLVGDTRRPFSEITEENLELVAERVADKHYDSVIGTTCHQCRQKTDDLKTVCRGDDCMGVRGQFCGPCLKNRYGEDAKAAIMNMEWTCPPCRNICNCSFCMKKRGKRATGILIHHARGSGYDSVKTFLGD